MPDLTNCQQCGKQLPVRLKAGQPRKFCDWRCRRKHWDSRHLVLPTQKVQELVEAAEGRLTKESK